MNSHAKLLFLNLGNQVVAADGTRGRLISLGVSGPDDNLVAGIRSKSGEISVHPILQVSPVGISHAININV